MDLSSKLVDEMKKDIEICEGHPGAEGSQQIYRNMIAKYCVIDENFAKNLSNGGKVTVPGKPFDFTPELRAIANKLQMMLLVSTTHSSEAEHPLKMKIEELLERGKRIGKEEFHPAEGGFPFSYVSGPQFNKWMGEIKALNERHLVNHPLYDSINLAYRQRSNRPGAYDDMIGYLDTLISDTEFWISQKSDDNRIKESEELHMSNKVFIVHGHDSAAKEAMARTLEKAGFEAIILHEQADMGMTIIEKIEAYTDVAFAVVLYTECDLGRAKEKTEADNRYRARQNVVFEHGYLIGKLGRNHVCAFVKGNVETPGDISGVVYTDMDAAGAWKMALAKNMNAIGLEADVYKMM